MAPSPTYGVGSITAAGDITVTVIGTAEVAYGPDELTQPFAPLLSPAYHSSSIAPGGPTDASGQILAQVFVGNSARLMRLNPANFCAADCVRDSSIQMKGKFVQDRAIPAIVRRPTTHLTESWRG